MEDVHNIPVSFHFLVDFGLGLPGGDNRFQEVTGIGAEVVTEDLKEGGADVTYKLPTGIKFNNLVLKRGLNVDSRVLKWCRDAIELFKFQPTDVVVVLLNEEHATLASWKFFGAWPVKWSVSDFKAQDNALVIESMELTYRIMRKL
ncbi:MAG: hypothetical protein B6D64_06460 [Bacteroidetes bacterium 4484_276]|nr:MAG: hypothetical protein B6D64_06460 [Bacteroidetes bacterium 4484_276]OYT12716.1 MAG: glycerol acyltransferase [Bacteroidetes bacterium 4572_114]